MGRGRGLYVASITKRGVDLQHMMWITKISGGHWDLWHACLCGSS